MGHDTTPNNILKALDTFLSSSAKTSIDKLNNISKLLETTAESMSSIQHKFKYYLESTSSWKIQKVLDLLEFLTVFNTGKLPSIVNTEKFMEVYATVIMEPEFKDSMLGMLRLWSDKYGGDRNQMDIVFNVTDNLQAYFEMSIPDSYKSKYEGIDSTKLLSGPQPDKSDFKKNSMPTIETVESFLVRAETAKNKAMSLLADVDFNEAPKIYRKSVVGVLLDDIDGLMMYLGLLEDNVLKPGTKETSEDLAKDLKRLQEELKKKAEEDHWNNVEEVENGEPQKKKMKKNSKQKLSSMMELSDFMTFKTHQCKEGMGCKYAPVTKKGIMTNKTKAEINCIYWHGQIDKRRLVCNEKGDLLYKFAMCRLKTECPRINNCGKSHNFYETYFHPLNYKKKKCSFPRECRYKEHCPYYHSSEEREKWREVLREYFAMKEDEEEVVEEDDDEDMEGDIEDNFRQKYNNAVRHLPARARAPRDDDPPYRNGKVEYYPKQSQKSNLKVESMDIVSQKPKTKELHSKLVIRKDFMDPSKLTEVLKMNSCFSGFCMMQGVMENGKKINGEQIHGKVE